MKSLRSSIKIFSLQTSLLYVSFNFLCCTRIVLRERWTVVSTIVIIFAFHDEDEENLQVYSVREEEQNVAKVNELSKNLLPLVCVSTTRDPHPACNSSGGLQFQMAQTRVSKRQS